MNWQNLNWEMYGVVVACLGVFYAIMRNFKNDIEKRFDKIDARFDGVDLRFKDMGKKSEEQFEKIDGRLRKIERDISDVKECMAFLEAANIYTMPMEPSQPNPRSLAAKEMWNRRRQKKLEKKGE